jgi:hypothetical protein
VSLGLKEKSGLLRESESDCLVVVFSCLPVSCCRAAVFVARVEKRLAVAQARNRKKSHVW